MKTLNILIFLLLFNTFILLGYLATTGNVTYERITANLTRVIDGDTIDTDLGKVRMLGINTPEKKQPYYQEAKDFLRQYEGKKVELERTIEDKDKYGRLLRYVLYGGKLVNEEILRQGFANFYSYNEDKYTSRLKKAEEDARENERGLWKKSSKAGCIELVNLQYVEQERCHNQEKIILENKCEKLELILKDDANHIYNIDVQKGRFEMNFSCVWNDEGDSVMIRDEEGMILFYRYP